MSAARSAIETVRRRVQALAGRAVGRVRRTLHPELNTKEAQAARFFIDNFRDRTPAQMDELVRTYWTRYRRLDELREVTGLDPADPALHLLDIGGGYSTVLRLFRSPFRWVLDICTAELERAGMPLSPDIRWLTGAGERVPFPDAFFDVVFCTNVIDHVEDPARVVAETRRALKPGGWFVLLVDLFHEGGHGHRDILHPHSFDAGDLERLVAASGLRLALRTTQPTNGKIGLRMLARGDLTPRNDRQEHILVLQR